MLAPIKHLLAGKRVVLASSSPRRRQLVNSIGLHAELCAPQFEEDLDYTEFKEFSQFVEATAAGKALEVYERLQDERSQSNLLVIAADTMVTLENDVYGKPKDADDAKRMLTNLAGKCNRVYTGVVLKDANCLRQFTETADVYFGELTKEQIDDYVASGDPLDKAGAYGIQGMGGAMISKINGDFYCVMGLPLHRLSKELCSMLLTSEPAVQ